MLKARGHQDRKKAPRVDFFCKASGGELTNKHNQAQVQIGKYYISCVMPVVTPLKIGSLYTFFYQGGPMGHVAQQVTRERLKWLRMTL